MRNNKVIMSLIHTQTKSWGREGYIRGKKYIRDMRGVFGYIIEGNLCKKYIYLSDFLIPVFLPQIYVDVPIFALQTSQLASNHY